LVACAISATRGGVFAAAARGVWCRSKSSPVWAALEGAADIGGEQPPASAGGGDGGAVWDGGERPPASARS